MTQGDHVRARRGGAWDHAIDVGDRTVIRFVPGAGFERCEYGDFVAGADRVEVVVHRERVFRPSLVVARAFSRFAEAAYAGMFRSPGQFAVWCKTDRVPGEEAAAPGPAPRAGRRKGPRAGKKAAPARRKAPRKAAARRAAPRRRPAPRKRARPAPGKAPRRRGARKARRR
jgi:hypothetical protein